MQKLGIVPVVDLCHFGVPDWLENFQNPELPERLAEYAGAFARRYPWVRLYTPVNEMFVAARMSALDGVWNEQLRSESAFVNAIRQLARASVLMMETLVRERPDAVFINSESSEFYQPCCPDPEILRIADFENQRRFIALDLVYGVPVRDDIRRYLLGHGMPAEEYEWFMTRKAADRAILGVDYYRWNEKLVNNEGRSEALGELFGWYVITSQYYQRYHRPVMHTETNCPNAAEAPGWLWRQWHNVQLIHQSGVPVTGFTWYSLQDQVDWDIGLSRAVGNVNPVGLYDLNRDPRPVADAYRYLLEMFGTNPFPTMEGSRGSG
jgi:beta-glucosidase/6-phospho-beta-glucosidase/beta-galactosidase